jgi:alcohol dehydrogenase class IV
VGGVGYNEKDFDALAQRAVVQKRLVDNAPMPVNETGMRSLFRDAFSYW